ncbi:MAG: hypothetical protein FWC76_02715 [Defluviitaleaceae bacterium]|nr:hypothetical protein [Defluviitaleaceae bacterium]
MKENYEMYEDLYERFCSRMYEEMDLDEKLTEFQEAFDNACELLEKLLDRLDEGEKKEKKEAEAAGFRLAKVGADIGEEKSQMDVIAKIFGNKSY